VLLLGISYYILLLVNDLQKDLSALEEWENKWQMSFHPAKCTVIRISTNRRNVLDTHYFLHGHKLEVVCDASWGFVSVIVADKTCCSALDFVKLVNLVRDVWIPGCRRIF
jgi:hypothetical protein